jgi:hypothetical protein
MPPPAALSDSCAAKWLRNNAGRAGVLDETDPMWGVYRFKQGFSGEFAPWIGAWDFPVSQAGYWAIYGCYAEGAGCDARTASPEALGLLPLIADRRR